MTSWETGRQGLIGVFSRWLTRREAPRAAPPQSADEIQAWLVGRVAACVGVPPQEIDAHTFFGSYGIDSRTALRLSGELQRWLGRDLSPTLLWDYPTIEELAGHLMASGGAPEPNLLLGTDGSGA